MSIRYAQFRVVVIWSFVCPIFFVPISICSWSWTHEEFPVHSNTVLHKQASLSYRQTGRWSIVPMGTQVPCWLELNRTTLSLMKHIFGKNSVAALHVVGSSYQSILPWSHSYGTMSYISSSIFPFFLFLPKVSKMVFIFLVRILWWWYWISWLSTLNNAHECFAFDIYRCIFKESTITFAYWN
jgi:hypothetical protein